MKIIILFMFVFILNISNIYAAEKNDCSEFKKLSHKYNVCKAGNLKAGTLNTAGKIKKGTGKVFKKLTGVFKKKK